MTALMLLVLLALQGLALGAIALLIAVVVVWLAGFAWPQARGSLRVRVGVGTALLLAGFAVMAFPSVLHNPSNILYFGSIWLSGAVVFIPWWKRANKETLTTP